MHELSIVLSMIDVAAEEAERQGGGRVIAIHLRLGPLSGVIRDALLGAWELACESSPLAGCRLAIEVVPITIDCPRCRSAQPARSIQDLCCAACGAAPTRILTGREMEVVALELIDDQVDAGPPNS